MQSEGNVNKSSYGRTINILPPSVELYKLFVKEKFRVRFTFYELTV